jgi:uncharacterized membrane protein
MMATAARRDPWKLGFFFVLALCVLTVLWVDERFLFIPTDHEWVHIAPFQGKLLIHALTGITAFLIGPFQFSDRLRARKPKLHRWMGRTYVGAVAISAPLAAWIGFHYEQPITAPEQIAQGGFWFVCTAMAFLCALKRQFVIHKVWMMRSYGFCLVFVMSRVPDAIPGFRWSDAFLAHTLWWLIAFALVGPDLILTTRTLWGKRRRAA